MGYRAYSDPARAPDRSGREGPDRHRADGTAKPLLRVPSSRLAKPAIPLSGPRADARAGGAGETAFRDTAASLTCASSGHGGSVTASNAKKPRARRHRRGTPAPPTCSSKARSISPRKDLGLDEVDRCSTWGPPGRAPHCRADLDRRKLSVLATLPPEIERLAAGSCVSRRW